MLSVAAESLAETFGPDAPATLGLIRRSGEALHSLLALEPKIFGLRNVEVFLLARTEPFQGGRDDLLEEVGHHLPVRLDHVLGTEIELRHDALAERTTGRPLTGILRRGADDGGHEQTARTTRRRLLRGHPRVRRHRRHHVVDGAGGRLLDLDLDRDVLREQEDRDDRHRREDEADDGHPRPVRRRVAGLSRRLRRRRGELDPIHLLRERADVGLDLVHFALDGLGGVGELLLQGLDVLVDMVADGRDRVLHAVVLAQNFDDRGLQTLDRRRRLPVHLSHGLGDRVRDERGGVPQPGVGLVELALELVLLLHKTLGRDRVVPDDLVLLGRDLTDEDTILFSEVRGSEHQSRVVVVQETEVLLTEVPLLLELGVDLLDHPLALLGLLTRARGLDLAAHHLDGGHLDHVGLGLIRLHLTLDLLGLGRGLDHGRVVLVGRDGRNHLRVRRSATLHGGALLAALLVAVCHLASPVYALLIGLFF